MDDPRVRSAISALGGTPGEETTAVRQLIHARCARCCVDYRP